MASSRRFDSSPVDVDAFERRTVKITIVGQLKNEDPRKLLVNAISSTVPTDHWKWLIRKERFNQWFLTVATNEQADAITDLKFSHLENDIQLVYSSCGGDMIRVRVHWLPAFVSDLQISRYFSLFGDVFEIKHETYGTPELISTYTGVRDVMLRIQESKKRLIPHRSKIDGESCLITMRGRPPLCLRCNEVGHIRSDCPRHQKKATEEKILKSVKAAVERQREHIHETNVPVLTIEEDTDSSDNLSENKLVIEDENTEKQPMISQEAEKEGNTNQLLNTDMDFTKTHFRRTRIEEEKTKEPKKQKIRQSRSASSNRFKLLSTDDPGDII